MAGQYMLSVGSTFHIADANEVSARLRRLAGSVVPRMVLSGNIAPEHMALLRDVLKTTTRVDIKRGSGPRTIDAVRYALEVEDSAVTSVLFPPMASGYESAFLPSFHYNKSLREVVVRDVGMLYACACSCSTVQRLSFFRAPGEHAEDVCWDRILKMPALRVVEFSLDEPVSLEMFNNAWPGCTMRRARWCRVQVVRAPPPAA